MIICRFEHPMMKRSGVHAHMRPRTPTAPERLECQALPTVEKAATAKGTAVSRATNTSLGPSPSPAYRYEHSTFGLKSREGLLDAQKASRLHALCDFHVAHCSQRLVWVLLTQG